jgi:hypothetical protein
MWSKERQNRNRTRWTGSRMGIVECVGEKREGKIMKKSQDLGEAGDKIFQFHK